MVFPTTEPITAKTRDIPHCNIVFTEEGDFGTPPTQIPIIIVYNGKDHYCSSRPKAETFKDGLDMIVEKLQDCVVISSTMGNCTMNGQIKQLLDKFNINVQKDVVSFEKVFHISKDTPIPKWDDTPRKETRQLPSKMKEFQCVCGVVKHNGEELISHVQRRHANDNWYCAYPGCKIACKAKKSHKLHLRIIHLFDYSHSCWYCDYGRHDKK